MAERPGALLVACLLSAFCAGGPGNAGLPEDGPALRFHHAHLRVADPAAEMDRHAREHGCEKLILQGLGVGVRCADAYLLFDRNDTPMDHAVMPAQVTVTGSGDAARVSVRVTSEDPDAAGAWLAQVLGPDASTDVVFARPGASIAHDAELTHVAFGALEPAPMLARLEHAGGTFLSRTEISAVLAGPGGVVLEVVRDLGSGPDAFWCPMHPDVRSPAAGICPLCGMALVPIPPPVFGNYLLDVGFVQSGPGRGRMTLRTYEPDTGRLATSFATIHDRLLHLFIVSRQLDVFQHVHPELQPDGSFVLDVEVPRPDAYALVADFYPAGGTPQMLHTTWVTPDYRGSPFPDGSTVLPDTAPKSAGTTRVSLETPVLSAGSDQRLTFVMTDARTGAPVIDLQPYLGAPAHLLIVSADLADVVHSHPAEVDSSGPRVEFEALFPRSGRYKMWVQFQRAGSVLTAAFVADVQ